MHRPLFMKAVEQIIKTLDPVRKNRMKLSVFLLFVFVSSILWLLIKLSDDYSMTTYLPVNLTDLPNDKWPGDQTGLNLKVTINSRGFVILRAAYLRNGRNLSVSLGSVPYRHSSQNEYYIRTANLRHLAAEAFNVNETNIEFEETELRFILDNLAQKKVAVALNLAISYKQQYSHSSRPQLTPDSILVYGPANILDTMQVIKTQYLQLKDVDKDVSMPLLLDYNKHQIKLEPNQITLFIDVDRFTETSFIIPIQTPEQFNIKTFPDRVQVNFMVSLSDFNKVEAAQFSIALDTTGISFNTNALKLEILQSPPMAKNISLSPESVEYIRIKQ